MNRLLVLLLVTASIAASGCTGVPPDVRTTVDWVAHDPETGEVVAQGSGLTFIVGQDESGLGRDLERSLASRRAGDNYTVRADDLDIDQEVRTPQLLGSDPAEGEVPIEAFNRSLGHLPEEGEVFDFNPFYQAQVVHVGEENLTYRFHIPGGEKRDPVPFVGAVLVSRIEDDRLVRILEPVVGANFTIRPPSPQNPNPPPLGLKLGTYVVVGAEDGNLVYRRSSAFDPALVGQTVEFRVTVREIQRLVPSTDLEEGQYGVRGGSPYVRGDPTLVTPLDHDDVEHGHNQAAEDAHAGPEAGHDDGHDDHGH